MRERERERERARERERERERESLHESKYISNSLKEERMLNEKHCRMRRQLPIRVGLLLLQ